MDEQRSRWSGRLDPKGFADRANQGFVALAQSLIRLIAGSRPGRRCGEGDGPGGENRRDSPASSRCRGSAHDPQFYFSLAERVERILRRLPATEHVDLSARMDFAKSSVDDESARIKIKELFRDDDGRRLAAARWIRERGFAEAIPALEGALSIEESEEVRDEIERGLRALRAGKR